MKALMTGSSRSLRNRSRTALCGRHCITLSAGPQVAWISQIRARASVMAAKSMTASSSSWVNFVRLRRLPLGISVSEQAKEKRTEERARSAMVERDERE